MPEDVAILDAPAAEDTAVDETPIDTPEGADDGQQEESQPPAVEPGQQAQPTETPAVNGNKLSDAARATLEEIKQKNPALAREIRTALFEHDRLKRELPGGLREVAQLRETIEKLGGNEGIQGLTQELNGWQQFDEMYTSADPKAIDFMVDTPEAQASFMKLAPIAFNKYAEINPEGFSHYVSNVFLSHMMEHQIPLMVERLADFLPQDNQRAQEIWGSLAKFVNGIGQVARSAPKPPEAKAAAPDNRAQDLDRREADLTRTEWRNESAAAQTEIFNSLWTKLAAGRKVSSEQKAAIQELFSSRLGKAIQSHEANLNRYFSAKDKAGFLKYADNLNKTELPKALTAAFNAVMPQRPGPKPAAAAPVAKVNGVAAKPDAGWAWVSAAPKYAEMDPKRNDITLFQSGKAILKDGRKVQWKRP